MLAITRPDKRIYLALKYRLYWNLLNRICIPTGSFKGAVCILHKNRYGIPFCRMPLTLVNRSAEVIVVGQVDTLINFCPNMVRFRIRPDFFCVCFNFRFVFFCCHCCCMNWICVILEICLFLMLSNEIQRFLNETNSENNTRHPCLETHVSF